MLTEEIFRKTSFLVEEFLLYQDSFQAPWNENLKVLYCERNIEINSTLHCEKKIEGSSRIWSFSGPYFPKFGMNTVIYGVNLRI